MGPPVRRARGSVPAAAAAAVPRPFPPFGSGLTPEAQQQRRGAAGAGRAGPAGAGLRNLLQAELEKPAHEGMNETTRARIQELVDSMRPAGDNTEVVLILVPFMFLAFMFMCIGAGAGEVKIFNCEKGRLQVNCACLEEEEKESMDEAGTDRHSFIFAEPMTFTVDGQVAPHVRRRSLQNSLGLDTTAIDEFYREYNDSVQPELMTHAPEEVEITVAVDEAEAEAEAAAAEEAPPEIEMTRAGDDDGSSPAGTR